jgi:FecR protein
MRSSVLLFAITAMMLGVQPAAAAPGDTIGSAVTIVNLVTAQLEQDQRRLASGDDVRQQELIEVNDDGKGELLLRDDTKLALGPGSRLLLDQFVYNPKISGGAIVLDLVQGAFRFITGVAAKPAYVIRTPTASITVRGTIFDAYVQTSGASWLLLIEGAIEVCSQDGKCVQHDEPGKLIRIDTDKVDEPVKWASLPGKQDVNFDQAFPFVVAPPEIDPDPVFDRDDIVLGTFPERPRPNGNDEAKDDGKKDKPQRKAKKSKKKKKHKKARRKRRTKDASNAKKLLEGFSIGIGIGIGGGGRRHRGGGGGGQPGGYR